MVSQRWAWPRHFISRQLTLTLSVDRWPDSRAVIGQLSCCLSVIGGMGNTFLWLVNSVADFTVRQQGAGDWKFEGWRSGPRVFPCRSYATNAAYHICLYPRCLLTIWSCHTGSRNWRPHWHVLKYMYLGQYQINDIIIFILKQELHMKNIFGVSKGGISNLPLTGFF